ncbi:MAG: efflux RND transporter periplasmic adaptor subunit, partial [Verrucomicrobiota bacterium]
MNPLSGAALALLVLAAAARAADPVQVRVAPASRGELIRFVTLPGTLRANQQVTLHSRVAGHLKSISFDRGDRVKAGQLLAAVEVPELSADRARYEAEVKVADLEVRRLTAARGKSPDLVTPQAVDDAQGRLEVARAQLGRANSLLEFAQISAPFAGVITARFVDPGAFLPTATGGPASAVVTLADTS